MHSHEKKKHMWDCKKSNKWNFNYRENDSSHTSLLHYTITLDQMNYMHRLGTPQFIHTRCNHQKKIHEIEISFWESIKSLNHYPCTHMRQNLIQALQNMTHPTRMKSSLPFIDFFENSNANRKMLGIWFFYLRSTNFIN